ncbi:GroES-like zinc-binding alcohol dehydrogenase family protein [Actinidia rufa]|uniref:GroES-like zinc-binding alcohol dehydrogenase family protein n=1 Tax=Actinidia rufa TaxID=165716 RepID=A0A7J0GZZ2_9ERIC|nr:GroES-like zinc-binding alcohol dehydrogenase family protein [Actinidia rufa]
MGSLEDGSSNVSSIPGDMAGKVITCRAAVAWGPGQPLVMEEVCVDPPQKMEVRIKILFTSICHTDLSAWKGENESQRVYPRILGHEASGIVESVGEGVMDLKEGDHVVPIFNGECGDCVYCHSDKTNLCKKFRVNPFKTVMVNDGKSRFSSKDGKPIFHFLNTSTFSEYTVLDSACVVKIDPQAPLKKMTLLSCGVSTGLGAAWNTAKVKAGSSVAIFGLGAVGLAVAEGARVRGASKIIGVDINPQKYIKGQVMGITDFLDPKDLDKPVHEKILEMTGGGVDYSFECAGNLDILREAFLSTHDVVNLDEFITHELPFSKINEAFQLLLGGQSLRKNKFMMGINGDDAEASATRWMLPPLSVEMGTEEEVMKSRSHRLPTLDPPDDWVNGSWTVDCVCGVNFDDGEEMVNCDECGVWVHTRCSRYVKSEKSFACDKCKIKSTRNDSEETEVAQLLVELPTKTLRIDNPLPPEGHHQRRPFRLWTDIPIEERVHVQGIPGGEPGLFGGLSSVFSPELWKCTGEEEKANAKVEEENENLLDKGAGVLFSLSKKNVMATPMTSSIGMKRQVVEGGSGRLSPCKDMKKWDVENRDVSCPQNRSKWKEEGQVVDGDGDHKKRVQQVSKTASIHSSGAKKAEFYEDGGPKIVKADTQSTMNVERSDAMLKDPLPGDRHVVENIVDKLVDNLGSGEHPSETLVSDVSGHSISMGARSEEEKFGHQVSTRTESSSKTDDEMASLLEHSDPGSIPIKRRGLVLRATNMGPLYTS